MNFLIIMSLIFQNSPGSMPFIPERVSKTATIQIEAPIEKVFPLFGPIKEMEWAHGWNPQRIYPKEAIMEEHMIFQTKSSNEHESHFLWMVTQLDFTKHIIEYTVQTPNRIWTISVQCNPQNSATTATVIYCYTGLNDLGNELNKTALAQMYTDDLKDWEKALNHYLKTGEVLKALHH